MFGTILPIEIDVRCLSDKTFSGGILAMRRVMIIDPDPSTEAFFQGWFEKDYEIDVATNGKMALEQFCCFNPDVAIVEIGLPDMPGWLVVQKMRKHIPHLPVIAIAENESWEDVRQMRIKAGPILFCAVKPLNKQEIEKTLVAAVALQQKQKGKHFNGTY